MPSPDPDRILKQHVTTDLLLGVEAVPSPPLSTAQADESPSYADKPLASDLGRRAPTLPPPRESAARPQPAAAAPARLDAVPIQTDLDTDQKHEQLAALADQFDRDQAVQKTRPANTCLVWADGSPASAIMFIGEGPGEQEDKQGLPFVGPAGELLNKMITAMGLDRQEVYIANVVKYRPPGNRTPNPEEVAAQGPYLAKQVAIVNPQAIVALGGAAAKFALQTQTGITRLRGNWAHFTHTNPPIPLMPTFHPAYLLRSYTPDNRKKVWADLQAVLLRLD
ncbi:MAG: uracil-DNA glycosylase [Planctomycetota bacterium]